MQRWKDTDLSRMVDRVHALQHRVGGEKGDCLCQDCRAIRQVCALANERIATMNRNGTA